MQFYGRGIKSYHLECLTRMATEQHQLGVHTYRIRVVYVGAYRCWHPTVRAYHMQISCLFTNIHTLNSCGRC